MTRSAKDPEKCSFHIHIDKTKKPQVATARAAEEHQL